MNELKQKMTEAIREAIATTVEHPVWSGCGRAYVCLSTKDRKTLNAFKAAMAANNIRYIGEAYGSGSRAAYIGYDNSGTRNISIAKNIEKHLRAIGVDCYWDGVSD